MAEQIMQEYPMAVLQLSIHVRKEPFRVCVPKHDVLPPLAVPSPDLPALQQRLEAYERFRASLSPNTPAEVLAPVDGQIRRIKRALGLG